MTACLPDNPAYCFYPCRRRGRRAAAESASWSRASPSPSPPRWWRSTMTRGSSCATGSTAGSATATAAPGPRSPCAACAPAPAA